jgi:hypothetical protein
MIYFHPRMPKYRMKLNCNNDQQEKTKQLREKPGPLHFNYHETQIKSYWSESGIHSEKPVISITYLIHNSTYILQHIMCVLSLLYWKSLGFFTILPAQRILLFPRRPFHKHVRVSLRVTRKIRMNLTEFQLVNGKVVKLLVF